MQARDTRPVPVDNVAHGVVLEQHHGARGPFRAICLIYTRRLASWQEAAARAAFYLSLALAFRDKKAKILRILASFSQFSTTREQHV